jgi:hypothetical protein
MPLWRGLSFFLDFHLWRALLDLGAEIFLHRHDELVRFPGLTPVSRGTLLSSYLLIGRYWQSPPMSG